MPKKIKAKRKPASSSSKKRDVPISTEIVASPWNNGFDKITRVVDTLEAMRRRGQISEKQYIAATRYREAFETCHGSIRSALNDSGSIRGAPGSKSLTPQQMNAAEDLSTADHLLGKTDGFVVAMVAGRGESIEATTAHLYGRKEDGRCREDDLRATGKRLRDSLTILAFKWFGADRRNEHQPMMADTAKLQAIVRDGVVERGTVHHAGHDARGRFKVRKSGG